VFCSRGCKERARQSRKRASEAALVREKRGTAPVRTRPPGRRSVPLFDVPERLDDESRRVVEYVNREIDRWNAGERDEPIDLILEAARDRLRRSVPQR